MPREQLAQSKMLSEPTTTSQSLTPSILNSPGLRRSPPTRFIEASTSAPAETDRFLRLPSGDFEVVEVPRQLVAVRAPLDADVEHPCGSAVETLVDRPHPIYQDDPIPGLT